MYKSKLISIFQTLTKQELRQLKKWVQSPIHNEHKDVQKLFEFLFTRYAFNEKILRKERAWKYIYSTKNYKDLRMRHLMSFSLDVLENFVKYKGEKSAIFNQEKVLAKQYFEKKLLKPANQTVKRAEKHLEHYLPQDETYHYHQYELEVLKFDLRGTQNRTRATNIVEITNHASLFFMITTLRYAYIALSHQSLQKTKYNIPLLDSVLKEIEQEEYHSYPILMIYYHGYQTLKDPTNETHFQELKTYLNTKGNVLGIREQHAVLLMTLNYAIKRLNTGEETYVREAFELYQKGLEEGVLIEGDQMSHFAYKNIVSLGIILKEYNWLDRFIPTYALKLEPSSQENYQHYSLARLTFARGKFEAAMELLVQAEYDDIMLNIGAKVMLLKLYYQQEYWDALDAFLESFRVFLNRKKELSYHKEHYTNLIALVKKVLSVPTNNKRSIIKLEEEIKTIHPLAERTWLLEQIKRL